MAHMIGKTGSTLWIFRSIAALLLTLIALSCGAQAADDLVGKKVFLKETARPKVGNKTLAWNQVQLPATVSKVEGDWAWIGKAWVKRGEVITLDDAPAYFTRTINKDPRAAYAYLLRGVAWTLKREYDNAIKDFSEAIRLEPGVHVAYNARGAAYNARHDYQKALADMTEAIRLAPSVGLYYNDRGCIYNSLDEYQKAEAQFQEAIRVDPKLALAWSNRASNWFDQKEFDKAIDCFETALKIDPNLWHAHMGRGYLWSKQGRYGRALEDWDEVIRLAPEEPWGLMNKARLWSTCASRSERDGKQALVAAKQACELAHWDEWRCLSALAAAYAECGKFEEAIQWQKKSIVMNRHPEEKDRIEADKRLKAFESHEAFVDPDVFAELATEEDANIDPAERDFPTSPEK